MAMELTPYHYRLPQDTAVGMVESYRSSELVDEAKKRAYAKAGELEGGSFLDYLRGIKMGVPIYHSRKEHLHPEELKRVGISTYKEPEQVTEEIQEALDYFGKGHKLRKTPGRRREWQVQKLALEEPYDYGRQAIHTSRYRGASYGWARNYPEIVSIALGFADVPLSEVRQYERERYGPMVRLKLKAQPSLLEAKRLGGLDLHTSWKHLPGEMIEEAHWFPEELFMDTYRGKGWIDVLDLNPDEQAVYRELCRQWPEEWERRRQGFIIRGDGRYFKLLEHYEG